MESECDGIRSVSIQPVYRMCVNCCGDCVRARCDSLSE